MTPDDLDFFADKIGVRSQQCAHEFTNNWITRCKRHLRYFCRRSPLATDEPRSSHGRNAYHSNGLKLGCADGRRYSLRLDVATLEPERDRVVSS
jgi:hypothetical protein